ncbi:glycosyltransferase family 2 protein [Paenibacillus polymyxa]|uniref:glycosyltransferase family 2 protein n=1 Tax=Paenibacillus polymyxa TaxID=1406 RepID=UPI002378D64F|nr:glycosyltransferase family 2 protein [Paenibacillus polymyxa]
MNNYKKRVLVGSPIRQKPAILMEFLESLKGVEQECLELSYLFIDDNDNALSSEMLQEFSCQVSNVSIHKHSSRDQYIRSEVTHSWNEQLVWKVAHLKNMIIQIALEFNYDYLFFIDSDIVLHPKTIEHLAQTDKEIISEIFWTKWQPDFPALPQVWIEDHYTMYQKQRNEKLSPEEAIIRQDQFLQMLRKPGVYEVGGLGACTLIHKSALEKGANFKEIKNISFWGEDRHFCIRAAALDIGLFVDTSYPAYHIYRESDLEGAASFRSRFNNDIESEVKRIVSDGIRALGSYHYALGYENDWRPYFSTELRDVLEAQIKQQAHQYKENHTKVNAFVENMEYISDMPDIKTHYVEFSLHNYILEKGERSEQHFKCSASVCYEEGIGFINSFGIESELRNPIEINSHLKP